MSVSGIPGQGPGVLTFDDYFSESEQRPVRGRRARVFQVMLSLTAEATQAIERILKAPGVPDGAGLRIIPVGPGDDSEVTSELQVEVAEQPGERDEVIEANGARVFVEDSLCGYLGDKMLDAEMHEERIRFSLAGQTAAPGTN